MALSNIVHTQHIYSSDGGSMIKRQLATIATQSTYFHYNFALTYAWVSTSATGSPLSHLCLYTAT